MYRIKPSGDSEYRYIITNNLFPEVDVSPQHTFDLKGSLFGRKASKEELKKKCPCYKDVDFIQQHETINIGKGLAGQFKDQVKGDSELLARMHLIDYSLLVGVHKLTVDETKEAKRYLKTQKASNKQHHSHHHKHHKDTKKSKNETKKGKTNTSEKEETTESTKAIEVPAEGTKETSDTNNNELVTEDNTATGSQEVDTKESKSDTKDAEKQEEKDDSVSAKEVKEDNADDVESVKDVAEEKETSTEKDEVKEGASDERQTQKEDEQRKVVVSTDGSSIVKPSPSESGEKDAQDKGDSVVEDAEKKEEGDSNIPSKDKPVKQTKRTTSDCVADITQFLEELQIKSHPEPLFWSYHSGLLGVNKKGELTGVLYFIGIIDILMDYTARKRVETLVKGVAAGGQDQVSSVSPSMYSSRFISFIHEHTQ